MQNVTAAMVKEIFAEDAREPATLITFEAAELPEPIRATDYRGDLGGGEYGLVSRGATFRYFPLQFVFGGASAEEPERTAKLEIANADGRIVEALRSISKRPFVTAELVRVRAPDNVEMGLKRSPVADIDANSAFVTLTIRPRNFDQVYACAKRYVIARTPSLF